MNLCENEMFWFFLALEHRHGVNMDNAEQSLKAYRTRKPFVFSVI